MWGSSIPHDIGSRRGRVFDEQTSHKVAQYVPGQFFGEVSLLTGDVRETRVTAATDRIVYEISKVDIDSLFAKRPILIESPATALVDKQLEIHDVVQEALQAEKKSNNKRVFLLS